MRSDRRRDLFVLQLDEVARERAIRRVAPGVDVDRLVVDALLIHVLQAGRRARTECDRAGEVVLGGRRQRRVLHEIPHLGHERVRVHVDDRHATAADHRATPWAGPWASFRPPATTRRPPAVAAATVFKKSRRFGIGLSSLQNSTWKPSLTSRPPRICVTSCQTPPGGL